MEETKGKVPIGARSYKRATSKISHMKEAQRDHPIGAHPYREVSPKISLMEEIEGSRIRSVKSDDTFIFEKTCQEVAT